MATIPNSRLLAISTPYSQAGAMYEQHKEFYGKDNDDVLVWQADSRTMNPTLSDVLIQRELERDPEGAQAEWLATFRTDVSSAFSPESLEACTIKGRTELPASPIIEYRAFCDPSGGKSDSFTLAIGHKGDDKAIVDLVRGWPAPFNPKEVVSEIATVLKAYGVLNVTGDRFAAEWPVAEFREHGIGYTQCELNKSELYLAFVPVTNSSGVELPDDKQLFNQLRRLERKRGRAGRDSVDHPPRLHDDAANSVAGVSHLLNNSKDSTRSGVFNASLHVSKQPLRFVDGNWPLLVGVSCDDNFAASVVAQSYNDEIRVFASFCSEGISLRHHLEEFTRPWLAANAPRLPLLGGYEDGPNVQTRANLHKDATEILNGSWCSIWFEYSERLDKMRAALVKSVPYKFVPAIQFNPVGTSALTGALASGRYREKATVDKKNWHAVNAFSLVIARLEIFKNQPKESKPRPLPPSYMSM
jgi:hypothetical protein